jgi:predicted transcriptional regulator
LDRDHLNKRENSTDNKQRICDYIRTYPGSHLRKISKDLNIAIGNIQYHLFLLEKGGSIKSRRINFRKVYYAASILGERHESILAILRQETPRDILLYLIENPHATQIEIAARMGFASPTVSWHMSRLIEIGLIAGHKEGKFVKYEILGDAKDVTTFLKSYYPAIWEKLSNRLADLFLDIAAASRSHDEGSEADQ